MKIVLALVTAVGYTSFCLARYKLFKLLVCNILTLIGLNLFVVVAGNTCFDIAVLSLCIFCWAIEAAETAMILYLFIVSVWSLGIVNIKI